MASVDYFLKIDGIPGESSDKAHKNEIDIQAWSWGESQGGTGSFGGGGGVGKVAMQDFNFTMYTNAASPKLMLACASGQHIASALLTCRKAGTTQQEYLKITFTDLLISTYSVGGSAGGESLPSENIAFNFAKIEIEYAPQQKDGSLGASSKVGWDLKQNVKV